MTRDDEEVMVTSSGDVLLVHERRYLSSPLHVSRDAEFDPLHQRAGDAVAGSPITDHGSRLQIFG